MTYEPTIEDIAYLAQTQPENFTSALQTSRSIRDAMAQGGSDGAGQIIEQTAVDAHYGDYLNNGGEALTESPIPPDPPADGSVMDTEQGEANCNCETLTPCIKKITVTCRKDGEPNQRVILKGESELAETDCKIYFVGDTFVSGEPGFMGYLQGTPLKDTVTVDIEMEGECPHGSHTVTWTDDPGETQVSTPGRSIEWVTETNPRPTWLNTDIFEPGSDHYLAMEALSIVIDMILNRAIMIKEEQFSITLTPGETFGFKAITVPSLRFLGAVGIEAPREGAVRAIPVGEGRALRGELGMGSRPRLQVDQHGWRVAANLTIVNGNTSKRVSIGSISNASRTYESGPSLRRQANPPTPNNRSNSGVDRIIGALSNAGKGLATRLTSESPDKIFNFYREGPELVAELGGEQVELSGAPGLTWRLMGGLSLDIRLGMRIDVYEALKRAASRHPAGRALVAFLEDAEDGRNLRVVEYQLQPSLYIDISIGVGSAPTEDLIGIANLSFTYDLMAGDLSGDGHVSFTLTAVVGGGIEGFFDSIVTDRTVFRYDANVATTGGLTVKMQDNAWGYQFFHRGAVLRVTSYKRINTGNGADRVEDGERNSSSSQVVDSGTLTEWVPDREQINSYRLTDAWPGEFTPFS
ncbi:MAG: hypothetical protein AB8B85_08350 [Paracoccaceae bacterium]